MKKFLAIMLVIAMIASLAACGGSGSTDEDTTLPEENPTEVLPEDEDFAGGYTVKSEVEAVELPEDVKAAFDLALEGYTGVGLTPIAYLGSQVVAGTNYAILCLGKVMNPTAKPTLKVAVINKDLEGNATMLRVNDFKLLDYVGADEETADTEGEVLDAELPTQAAPEGEDEIIVKAAVPAGEDEIIVKSAPAGDAVKIEPNVPVEAPDDNIPANGDFVGGGLAGGWTLNTEFPEAVLDEREAEACTVLEGVMGVQYQPIACLATQVVAGTNFAMLVKATMPAADDAVELRVVTIYDGVDGSLEVLGTKTINLADIVG